MRLGNTAGVLAGLALIACSILRTASRGPPAARRCPRGIGEPPGGAGRDGRRFSAPAESSKRWRLGHL